MRKAEFLSALKQLGGKPDSNVASAFEQLFITQQKLSELEKCVSAKGIDDLQSEIDLMQLAIKEVKENNEAHEKSIFACSNLLGTLVIKKEFANLHQMRYQRDKYKKLCEVTEKRIEALREELNKKPKKISAFHKDPYYLQVVDDYSNADAKLDEVRKLLEAAEIDDEARAFSLADEINEYHIIAQRLNLHPPEFNAAEALGEIICSDSDSASDDDM